MITAALSATYAKSRARCSTIITATTGDNGVYSDLKTKQLALWSTILSIEITTGTTFLVAEPDLTLYMVVGLTHEIIGIPRSGRGGDKFWAYLNRRYGLTEREKLTVFIHDSFRAYAMQHGARVELRRFAAYRNDNAYLSTYDGTMWRIDGETITRVSNGEDDVFFADDDGGLTIEPDIGQHGVLVDRLTDVSFAQAGQGGITAEQMKMAFVIWIFALALPDLMPTKPLLILEGAPGAGKSACVQLLQLALMGQPKPMILSRSKEDDFGVLLLRSPIAVFDNTDAYIDWVPDAICAYTTAGIWTKRRLYTDGEEVIIRPHAFIAISSKNPVSFRREDVADRSIILRLERRDSSGLKSKRFQALKDEIYSLRPKLVGEYIWYVNEIVKAVKAGHMALGDEEGEAHRMADFAALGRVVGHVLGWENGAVEELMMALQSERDAFINEEDPLAEILSKWLAYRPKSGHQHGREVGLFQLFQELETIAQANGIPFYKSAKVLAQKLRSPHIESDFIVQTIATDGHKSYRIWPIDISKKHPPTKSKV